MDDALPFGDNLFRPRPDGGSDPIKARLEAIRRFQADLDESLGLRLMGRRRSLRPSGSQPDVTDGTDTAVDHVFSLVGLDPDDVPPPEDIGPCVLRLRRSYSTTAPDVLQQRIDARLRQIRRLLIGEGNVGRKVDLKEAVAWLTLLRGTAQADLLEFEGAQDSVLAAREMARSIGHDEIEAWTWETSAWMAVTDGRQRDARDYAEEGIRVAPAGTHGLVAATMQRARINAALHDVEAALADLKAGEKAHSASPEPEWPDDHYSIDSAKVAFFTSGALAQLKFPKEAITYAAEVVRRNEDPSTHNFWPMRVANARVEWATALADLGEEDEAEAKAKEALDPRWLRPDTERRMEALQVRLRDPRIKERLAEALFEAKAHAATLRIEKRLLLGP